MTTVHLFSADSVGRIATADASGGATGASVFEAPAAASPAFFASFVTWFLFLGFRKPKILVKIPGLGTASGPLVAPAAGVGGAEIEGGLVDVADFVAAAAAGLAESSKRIEIESESPGRDTPTGCFLRHSSSSSCIALFFCFSHH